DIDGVPIIAMQRVDGVPLSQLRNKMTREQAIRVVQQAALAVHQVHLFQVIHRDLKPGNILVEQRPEGWHVFVCDFGLARDLSAETRTQSQLGLGTLGFMAPEQFPGKREQMGARTDIYGLGATLHALLLGEAPSLPLRDRPTLEWLSEGAGWKALSLDLKTILAHALEPDPRDRYVSAAAFAEDLRRLLEGESLSIRPVGWWVRGMRWWVRHPRMALSSALVVLGLSGVSAWGIQGAWFARSQLRAAERFSMESKDIEHLLRLERMRPAHDMRPAYQKVRERMQRLRTRMAAMGKAAQGPGYFSLGRGYLSIGEFKPALEVLEKAWALGFRNPDTAYALGRAHVGLFWEEKRTAGFRGDRQMERESAKLHFPKAKEYFSMAEGQSFEHPALAEAWLARMNRDTEAALNKVLVAVKDDPWDFEAKTYEVSALARLGFDGQGHGDDLVARKWYGKAKEASTVALALGRSDESTYQVDINWRLAWIGSRFERGEPDYQNMDEVERLSEQLLSLNPENPVSVSNKLLVIYYKALAAFEAGRNPNLELDRGINIAKALPEAMFTSQSVRVEWMMLHALKAEWAMSNGVDPEPFFREALKNPGHSDYRLRDYLGETLNLKARWEAQNGRDPRPILNENIAGMKRLFDGEDYYTAPQTLAQAWLQMAEWEAAHGMDVESSLRACDLELDRAFKLNSRVIQPYLIQCNAERLWASISKNPQVNSEHLRLAQEALHKGVALRSGDTRVLVPALTSMSGGKG
ncbi:MAG: serine/threonine-protein kinase, partial [Holophaga sp.]